MYKSCNYIRVYFSLAPRPHLQGGYGSGPALRNFHAPMRLQLWLSHMTSLPQECNITILANCCSYKVFNFADQSDSRLTLLPVVITCKCSHRDQSDPYFIMALLVHAIERNRSAQVHQTLSLLEDGVWE